MSDRRTDAFLAFSDLLQNEQRKNRDAVAANGASFLGDLISARKACTACIASVLSRPDRAFAISEIQQKLGRAAIHSAVIQGIHFVAYAIEHGGYTQAAALVRQEVDAIIVVHQIRLGMHRDKKNPNWKFLPRLKGYASLLSGLTHMSDQRALLQSLSDLPGSVDYTFNPNLARKLFGLHVCALIYVIFDMIEFSEPNEAELMNDEEQWWFSAAIGVMVKEGLLPAG